jgi:hypothetical protein
MFYKAAAKFGEEMEKQFYLEFDFVREAESLRRVRCISPDSPFA